MLPSFHHFVLDAKTKADKGHDWTGSYKLFVVIGELDLGQRLGCRLLVRWRIFNIWSRS